MFLFRRKSISIGITDNQISVLELEISGKQASLIGKAIKELPAGTVDRGRIKNPDALKKAISAALSSAKPQPISPGKVIFILPEATAYYHVFEAQTDMMSIDEKVKRELQTVIPQKISELYYWHKEASIAGSGKDQAVKSMISAYAVPAEIADEWKGLFLSLNFEIDEFDIESSAMWNGLDKTNLACPACAVGLDEKTTLICIADGQGLYYSYSMNYGVKDIVKHLSAALQIPQEEALILAGDPVLVPGQKERLSFESAVEPIKTGMEEAMSYFLKKTGKEIKCVVAVGSFSKIGPLIEYLKRIFIGSDFIRGKPKDFFPGLEESLIKVLGALSRDNSSFTAADPKIKPYRKLRLFRMKIFGHTFFDPDKMIGIFQLQTAGLIRLFAQHKNFIKILIIACIPFMIAAYLLAVSNSLIHDKPLKQPSITVNNYKKDVSLRFQAYVQEDRRPLDALGVRIIEATLHQADKLDIARKNMENMVQAQVAPGEKLIIAALEDPFSRERVTYPVRSIWLAYDESQALAVSRILISERLGHTGFMIDSLELDGIEIIDADKTYKVRGKAVISSARELPEIQGDVTAKKSDTAFPVKPEAAKPAAGSAAPKTAKTITKVIIKELGGKMLNVRKEPETKSRIIEKAYSGETYDMLSEKSGWYEISLPDKKTGWIMSDFAIKKK